VLLAQTASVHHRNAPACTTAHPQHARAVNGNLVLACPVGNGRWSHVSLPAIFSHSFLGNAGAPSTSMCYLPNCADKLTYCMVSRHFILQFLGTFHQCVKRELPYEAVHLYQKIKQAEDGKPDLALCNALLNVAVGEL
jgi:hypothetical protein